MRHCMLTDILETGLRLLAVTNGNNGLQRFIHTMGRVAVIFIWILYSSLGDVFQGCQSPQYLTFRRLGIVHCNLNDTFSAVFWYNSTNILNDEPVVTLTHSIKGGQGYTSGEFDITPDGSLLIVDVGLNHEKNFTMARFASFDENPSTFTVSVVVTGIPTDDCDSPQYLEYGRTGIVHCYFEIAFESVYWYNSTLVMSDPPIVTYYRSAKGGRAFESGEFDLFPNGSLIINKVGLAHENNFTVAKFTSLDEDPVYFVIRVIVTVQPIPAYPVVEGCNLKRYCVLKVPRKGNLTCTVTGIRPEVRLEWKVSNETSSAEISFFDHTSTVTKSGETFNITLTTSYRITSVTQLTVECGSSGSVRDVFLEKSLVNLLLAHAPIKPTDDSNVAVKILAVFLFSIVAVLLICGLLLLKAQSTKHHNKKTQRIKSSIRLPLKTVPENSRKLTRDIREILVHQLKHTYKRLHNAMHPIPFIRDRLVGINTVFVEGCVEKLKTSSGKIDKRHGELQDYGPSTKGERVWVKLDSYSDMVNDTLRNSGRLILEGEPGYGKSTVTLQMAYDWCNDVSYLEDVEIFILLRLRQLGGAQSIYQAIQHFILPFNSQITETDLQYILAHSESLMIVLDGYDEYPVKYRGRNNFLTKILIGDMFQNARVILTTSPSVLPNHCAPQTQRIRLTGFDDKARGEYIRKAVVRDDETAAKNIKRCISENFIVNDLCQTPFFFAIAVHMCQESEGFKNLKNVTGFFKLMMSCFHKANEMNLYQWESSVKNHDKLNKEAFESLNGNKQLSYWQKEKLLERLGQDLYDQYVGAGILVEEEICDVSDTHRSLEYTHLRNVTAVRFYHHLLSEWYAAHYLAMMISKFIRAAKRTSGLGSAYSYNLITKITKNTESLLSKIKPFHLQYIYRFACGLNHKCTVPIAQYLQDNGYNKCFIILCIVEQEENVGNILDYVTNLCSTDIFIINANTVLQQKSTIQLLEIASAEKVPISKVRLIDSFKKVNRSNESIQLQSDIELPVLATLKEIEIVMKGEALTEEEFEKILKYLSKCPQLEKLSFSRCCLPDSLHLESDLKVGHIKVVWSLSDKKMHLNHQTGKWESFPSTETTSSISSDSGNKSRTKLHSKKELNDLQSMPTAFRYLSSQLSADWRCIGRSLGIQDSKLDHMNTENTCTQERNYLMFIHWRELNGDKASYVNLIKALKKAGRNDLAEDLQNLKRPRRVSPSTKTSHFLRLKMTNQTDQLLGETTTRRQRRKFHEESMELTFHYLSRNLGKEWLDVGRRLLLSEAELYHIKADCTSTQEAIYSMLHKWKMKKGCEATYDDLTNCLREVGREDLATEFREREGNVTNTAPFRLRITRKDVSWLTDKTVGGCQSRKRSELYEHLDIDAQDVENIRHEQQLRGDNSLRKEVFSILEHGLIKKERTRGYLLEKLYTFDPYLARSYLSFLTQELLEYFLEKQDVMWLTIKLVCGICFNSVDSLYHLFEITDEDIDRIRFNYVRKEDSFVDEVFIILDYGLRRQKKNRRYVFEKLLHFDADLAYSFQEYLLSH